MFNVGDHLICRSNVYKVLQINEKYYNNIDYYILIQIDDASLKMEVPINSDKIRSLISKNQIDEIIDQIPNIPEMDFSNVNYKVIETEYKKLLNSGKHEDLIKIIKTSYLRNKIKIENNKPPSDKNEICYNLAEKYLYTEISIVLGISYDDTKKMIIDKISELNK